MTENWCSGLDKRIVVLFCTDMLVRKRHLWLFTMIDLLVTGLIPHGRRARCMRSTLQKILKGWHGNPTSTLRCSSKYTTSDFDIPPVAVEWMTTGFHTRTLILAGRGGIGKTSLASALLLQVSLRKESLARCSCGLIHDFDDMIWYCHDVPDHSKCRSSMLNLLQQLEKEGVGDVAAPPVPPHASSNDDLPGHQEPPYDEATIAWMVHVRKWLLTSFRNETSGEDGNTMLGRILQLLQLFFPRNKQNVMIRKIDWLLQSETGWQKFTQKTKGQPEKILSDFKKLLGTNADILDFVSAVKGIIQQDFRDFFVICLEKWCHIPIFSPTKAFFPEASPKRTASVARDGLSGRPNEKTIRRHGNLVESSRKQAIFWWETFRFF